MHESVQIRSLGAILSLSGLSFYIHFLQAPCNADGFYKCVCSKACCFLKNKDTRGNSQRPMGKAVSARRDNLTKRHMVTSTTDAVELPCAWSSSWPSTHPHLLSVPTCRTVVFHSPILLYYHRHILLLFPLLETWLQHFSPPPHSVYPLSSSPTSPVTHLVLSKSTCLPVSSLI